MSVAKLVAPISETAVELSVILVAEGSGEGLVELVDRYRAVLDRRGESYEFLIIYDSSRKELREAMRTLAGREPPVTAIEQRPWRGHDNAIATGIRRAAGEIILNLPKWPEIDPEAIGDLIDAVAEVDLATGQRTGLRPARDLRAVLAGGLLKLLFQQRFGDLFCRTRAGRREVFCSITDFGVRQHFLPLVAVSEGYRVREIPVPPAPEAVSRPLSWLKPASHLKALADILALYVALRFLKRPLRFFGAIGAPLMLTGGFATAYLASLRLFFDVPLADRPALVFAVMVLVLGVQIIAIGLIGEIIIFATTRRLRSYEIDRIIRGRP